MYCECPQILTLIVSACCPTRNVDLGGEGGVPPNFFLLLRKACKNRRVAVALQAHLPAVHQEMTIWGMKGGPPAPLFLWLNLIFFVNYKGIQKFKIVGKPLLGEK